MADPAQVIQALGGINGEPVVNEALAAAATVIKPGHLLEELAAGTVQEHGGAGLNAQRLVALTDLPTGGTIDDVYTVAATVRYGAFHSGQETFMRLAASASAVVIGKALESDGDGTVRILTTDTATDDTQRDSIVAYALEAVDNSGGGSEVFIKVRIA